MLVENELLGYPRLKIMQDSEMFSFSIDSVLLANFVRTTKKTKKIIDLGDWQCGHTSLFKFKNQSPYVWH